MIPIITIFCAILVLVLIIPPLASWASANYKTFEQTKKALEKTVPATIIQLCDAKKVIDTMDQKLTMEVINAIPNTNDKVKTAKQNLVKIYNGVSLTVKELQTLEDLPKHSKLKLNIYDVGKKLKENPQILCNFIQK